MANRVEVEIGAKDLSGPGWDSATKRAVTFKGALAELEKPLGGLFRQGEQLKGTLASLGVLWAANAVRDWHVEIQKTIGSMADQADAVGLTTDQLQAYQAAGRRASTTVEEMQTILGRGNVVIGQAAAGEEAAANAFKELGVRILDNNGRVRDHTVLLSEAARQLLSIEDVNKRAALSQTLFGRSGSQLTPVLREIATGMAQLDYNARAAGQTVSKETIEIFRKLNDQSDETAIRIRNMYAEMAAPIQFTAMQTLNGLLSNVTENAKAAKLGIADLLMLATTPHLAISKLFDLAGPTAAQQLDSQIAAKKSALDVTRRTLDAMGAEDARRGMTVKAIEKEEAALAGLVAASERLNAATAKGAGQGGVQDNAPDILPSRTGKFAVAKSGGGGSEKRDRIGEEIAKLSAETQAAEAGLRVLQSVRPGTVLADLERAADLEKKIGEIIAASGKYKPSDERIAQLRVEAAAAEGARQAYEKKKQVLELADATEAKYGNGQRQLRDTQQLLQAAVDTGRLSQEAYNAAMLEAGRTAEDQTLKLRGLQDGLEGLAAGMQYAAAQEARQNTVFNLGVQSWQKGSQIMTTALADWATGADVSFGKVEQSFAQMLLNMAASYAASQLGSLLGNLATSLFSAGVSAGTGAGGVADGSYGGSLSYGGPRAGGGPVGPGMAYLVGEKEPEIFVPDQAGTIVPMSRTGRGGGDNVSIANTYYFGSDVNRATLMTWAEKVKSDTVAAVIAARRAGGPMKRAFG